MLLASAEYQYYFTDTWRGALFFDAGSVNNEDEFDFDDELGNYDDLDFDENWN